MSFSQKGALRERNPPREYSTYFHPYAQADYDNIFGFIHAHSPQGAVSWDLALDRAISKLTSDPIRYGRIPETVDSELEHKQISFRTKSGKPYRLIFVVEEKTITVLRIRGPGQADITPEDLPNA